VGLHYVDFHQVSDAEVVAALDAAALQAPAR
jgi:predicted phosphoribosyltransferase